MLCNRAFLGIVILALLAPVSVIAESTVHSPYVRKCPTVLQEPAGGNDAPGAGADQEPAMPADPAQEPEESAKPAPAQDGQADLDAAFDLKIQARTSRDLDRVVELCDSAIRKGLSEEARVQANELLLTSLLENAEELSSRILVPEPDRRWRMMRGEALKRLKRVTDLDAGRIEAWMLIGKLNFLPGGDAKAAAEAAERAVKLAESRPRELSEALLLRAAAAGDDTERCLSDLNQAIKIDGDNLAAIRTRAFLLIKMGQADKALDDLETWLTRGEAGEEAWYRMAIELSMASDAAAAMKLLDRGIAVHPESSMLYLARARFRASSDRTEEALADADRAVELDADNAEAWSLRSSLLIQADRAEDALASIERLLQLEPMDVQGHWLRSLALIQREKLEESLRDLRWLEQTVEENSDFGLTVRLQTAAVLNAVKQPRKAIELLDAITRKEPGNVRALRGRGDAWLSLGEHRRALEDYEKALAASGDDSGLLNNFAWVLATSPDDEVRDGKRATEMALKACELTDYKAPHILSTLASAYAETGDFETARKWAAKAVEMAESDKQREGLQKELESYERNEPWRERENVEAEAAASGGEPDGQSAKPPATEAPGADSSDDSGFKGSGEETQPGKGGDGDGSDGGLARLGPAR